MAYIWITAIQLQSKIKKLNILSLGITDVIQTCTEKMKRRKTQLLEPQQPNPQFKRKRVDKTACT
jgi:hypothetical protein